MASQEPSKIKNTQSHTKVEQSFLGFSKMESCPAVQLTMQLEPVETRRVTGAARVLHQPVHYKREDCQYFRGIASCSGLPSSQEIHKTTMDRDHYLNLCSAGSMQRLGAQWDPRNPVHPPAVHSTSDYPSSSKSYQPTRAPGSTRSLSLAGISPLTK
ncbi:hypothetical protein CRENBAI_004762 [Crenichthys baileyi]|uniref:Uncharacterized protein n=1 Tax=Crenichthys baileyi TaxID=28760 RepID=A0AAV9RGP4_9TELE